MIPTQSDPALAGRKPQPARFTPLPGLDLHAEYHSVRTGGDFFDAIHLGSHVIFLLTDIAGTRESTQPIAADVQATFRRHGAELFRAPNANVMDITAQLAQEINHEFIRASRGVRFAPTFLGSFDLVLGILAYVNAGALTAVFHDSSSTHLLTSPAVPMGLFTHLTYEPSVQAFERGAKLLIVTKGVMETQHGRAHFGVDRLIPLLQDSDPATTNSATEICHAALKAAEEFKQVPWYSLHNLPFGHKNEDEDLTAMALVRPLKEASVEKEDSI
ncbi:PP2C family protein-serine/threonine phosphatase [Granulicella sp. S190]|uniref:PP2C family protein-serine/threonine phosphatase n=1 Tax=Granulicella sp. S190 TaxID=1747226 RepID=UPI00131ACD9D|nr:SpoIIE family protein phosphatase [Granulicella sp. S190]